MSKVILETERIILREAEITDASFVLELLNSKPWLANIGDRNIRSIADAESYIHNSLISEYEKNGYGGFLMVEKKSNKVIGNCGIFKRTYMETPDLGFAVLEKYMRQGLVYEAASALVKYAFTVLDFDQLKAITTRENLASRSLLEKLHFAVEGTIIDKDSQEELLLYARSKQ
jgi:RimJ/RimL family protein N-acetyltransferase